MTIFTGVGSPGTVSTASGGKIYAYNVIAEGALLAVAPANSARREITFHNPGAADIFVFPVSAFTSQSAQTPTTLVPSNAALGGCFRVYGNGGSLRVTGECQQQWLAFSVTGSGAANPLTVMDSNV